eukprot:Rmarinus@m.28320
MYRPIPHSLRLLSSSAAVPKLPSLASLQRGWATSPEECDHWCEDIVGEVPKDLRGTFLRNGPGMASVYGTKLEHPIDGDGLIGALSFKDGRAHFRARFVRTKDFIEDEKKQQCLADGAMGTYAHGRRDVALKTIGALLRGKQPHRSFRNPSNTNVYHWGDKLVSCYEYALPYTMDPSTLETHGATTFNNELKLKSMTAHFCYDPKTHRIVTHAFRPSLRGNASLQILEFDESWKCHKNIVLKVPGLNYTHDFAITENYYILQKSPFVKMDKWDGFRVLLGMTSPGELMQYYPELPCEFVFIPRADGVTSADVFTVSSEPCHIFHFGGSHEEGNKVRFTACCLPPGFNMQFQDKVWLSNFRDAPGYLHDFEIDVKQRKQLKNRIVDAAKCEFPVSHPYRDGLPTRYVYLMGCDHRHLNLPFQHIVKVDLLDPSKRQVWYAGADSVVGEPAFVPRGGYASKALSSAAEDDGHLVCQVYDSREHKTSFVVLDAQDLRAGPVARIRLPHHIPYGFHGTFTPGVWI